MQSLRDVFRAMKRGQKLPLICPICGSPVKRNKGTVMDMWTGILPQKYYCTSCKYSGFLAMEKDDAVEEELRP